MPRGPGRLRKAQVVSSARFVLGGREGGRQGGFRDFIRQQFGDQLDFGACYVGKNLNLQVLRGYGRLDALSCISAPDVFDQIDNDTGTQRSLNEAHARECKDYAIGADAMPPEESPRFFPELLFNARDTNVIELYNVEDPSELY